MQRRNVVSQSANNRSTQSRGGGATTPNNRNGSNTLRPPSVSTLVLVIIAALLTVASYTLPKDHKTGRVEQQLLKTEQRVLDSAYATEQTLEHELNGMWSNHGIPSTTGTGSIPANEASLRMQQQNSQWVDGEKKLKAKLKELAVLQAQGKELGVPVATRWLGDDIPVWAGSGVDVNEWKKKVEARYSEMRDEELRWKKMVAATLQAKKG